MSPTATTVTPFYSDGPRTLPTQATISPSERDVILPAIAEWITSDLQDGQLSDRPFRAAALAHDADHGDMVTVSATTTNIIDLAILLDLLATGPVDQPTRIRHPRALAGLHRLLDGELERAFHEGDAIAIERWRPLAERLNVAHVSSPMGHDESLSPHGALDEGHV